MIKLKLKNTSSLKKRFKFIKHKIYKFKKSNKRHFLTKKSSKRKRNLKKYSIISKKNIYLLNKCLPYKN